MTPSEISKLKQGDVVRNTGSGAGYIVLSNRTGVPTVVRSIEIHNAAEWEHVYTTTPVVVRFTAAEVEARPKTGDFPPAPAPVPAPTGISLVEKIMELEKLGWKFDETLGSGRWVSPNGVLRTHSLHSAWTFRNDYPKPFKGAVVPSSYDRALELIAAGWLHSGPNDWRSPSGEHFLGSYRAWIEMDKRKAAFTSFAEARIELRAAGWLNPYGKVWRSPKGEYFDGARAAFAAMTEEVKPKAGDCNAT